MQSRKLPINGKRHSVSYSKRTWGACERAGRTSQGKAAERGETPFQGGDDQRFGTRLGPANIRGTFLGVRGKMHFKALSVEGSMGRL